ncbi:hypothetical protein CP967_08510 [Streptomyces nitrosporeus]|uniref:Uncharacterized protein n=1 Tax=Streptomyces nitrosporeus TaxID=28894 RepID=A0A5J6F8S6_9ACTN|nr:hypothetical protein [Streptomyces nitrosporeus]QEU72004.1 hypothetical protein CP967_08510 [Streptomyces nitrosporeus]GGY81341.1 hypothetical protein GCM10010327_10000 [Streptomyces nitrosporeus]
MTPIPPAARTVMLAGLDEYRLVTPLDEQTPAGALDCIERWLLDDGWAIRPDLSDDRGTAR